MLSDFNGDEVWLGNGDGTFTYSNTLAVTPAMVVSPSAQGCSMDPVLRCWNTNLLQPGTHSLTATCGGNNLAPVAIYEPSTSPAVTVVISATSTTTTLSASTASPTVGAVVTFAATVGSSSGVPFGGVSFFDGGHPGGNEFARERQRQLQ